MITAEVKYKKTGIHWMTEVPEHWEIVRLKWVLRTGEGIKIGPFGSSLKLEDLDDNGIRVYGQENVIKDDFSLGKRFLSKDKFEELSVYEVFPNDILVTMMGTTGKCKLVPKDAERGIMDSHLIRLRANEKIRPAFLSVLINDSIQLKFQMSTDSKGSIMSGLNSKIVKNLFLPLPPIEEQDIILENLSTESAKITRFIQSKQRFIELLKEQRQSIITNAVTKGIDENVRMKETGVDWIPQIPESWKKRRLRFLVKITTGKKNTEDRIDAGEYPFYVRSQTIERINSFSFDGEGILTAGDGVGVGKVFHYVNGKFDFHQRVYLFYDIDKELEGEFLFNYLQANMMSELMRYNSKSTVDSIRLPVIKNFLVVFPEREEQKRILEHIKSETSTLDTAINKAEREIELIKEYREAMIAEAVTGKMKL